MKFVYKVCVKYSSFFTMESTENGIAGWKLPIVPRKDFQNILSGGLLEEFSETIHCLTVCLLLSC